MFTASGHDHFNYLSCIDCYYTITGEKSGRTFKIEKSSKQIKKESTLMLNCWTGTKTTCSRILKSTAGIRGRQITEAGESFHCTASPWHHGSLEACQPITQALYTHTRAILRKGINRKIQEKSQDSLDQENNSEVSKHNFRGRNNILIFIIIIISELDHNK